MNVTVGINGTMGALTDAGLLAAEDEVGIVLRHVMRHGLKCAVVLADRFSSAMSADLRALIQGTILEEGLQRVNGALAAFEPWQVVALSVAGLVVLQHLWHFLFVEEEPFLNRAKLAVFKFARKIPFVRNKIKSELDPLKLSFEKSMLKTSPNKPMLTHMPAKGSSFAELTNQLDSLRAISPLDKRVEEFKASAPIRTAPRILEHAAGLRRHLLRRPGVGGVHPIPHQGLWHVHVVQPAPRQHVSRRPPARGPPALRRLAPHSLASRLR